MLRAGRACGIGDGLGLIVLGTSWLAPCENKENQTKGDQK